MIVKSVLISWRFYINENININVNALNNELFSVSTIFCKNFTQCDVIFAEEETKPSDDEEPDCE